MIGDSQRLADEPYSIVDVLSRRSETYDGLEIDLGSARINLGSLQAESLSTLLCLVSLGAQDQSQGNFGLTLWFLRLVWDIQDLGASHIRPQSLQAVTLLPQRRLSMHCSNRNAMLGSINILSPPVLLASNGG
jgi:hypothetical protein